MPAKLFLLLLDIDMTTGLPFDDIRGLIRQMPAGDEPAAERTRATLYGEGDNPDKLREMAIWLSRWSGKAPAVRKPLVAVFAGTQGVETHGISSLRSDDTALKVEECAAGTASLNRICAEYDLGLQVYDLALDLPTGDMSVEASLDEKSCAATLAFGMEAIAGGVDLLCIGSFGVGDDVVSSAILAALHGGSARDWLSHEVDPALIARQVAAVDRALGFHRAHLKDPLEVLRRFGGRQFAAIAGAIIAARTQKVPVVLDGAAAIAAASILRAIRSDAVDHCLLAQMPSGDGFGKASTKQGWLIAFESGMSNDGGVCAALSAGLIRAAASLGSVQMASRPGGRADQSRG